ncbi:MAG: protein phosphatase CheZ [Azovibrio sp.]|nr:protein phosphatase CheZ [Azovibrio sp.]
MNSTQNKQEMHDSPELEALFDSVAAQRHHAMSSATSSGQDSAFNRVGQLMRKLNETLRELGYDALIKDAVHHSIPDTRERLAYVARVTENAASRVLNATDTALPLQEALQSGAKELCVRWKDLYACRLSVEEFKQLAADTVAYLDHLVPENTGASKAQLMEIMMAQDFQDLTGQVIKKIVDLVQDLERQLVSVLIDLIPDERRNATVNSLINGPVIDSSSGEVVVSQAQVDDLLESLGF